MACHPMRRLVRIGVLRVRVLRINRPLTPQEAMVRGAPLGFLIGHAEGGR